MERGASVLNAKAASSGQAVVAVGPRSTSRMCLNAGTPPRRSGPHRRSSTCIACGHDAHADRWVP
ncbi:zinc ribbon domain-containing protein [Streptomyces sp. NPDC005500]|uniref:zinc ribbon domain-containing protein n=1 Tax=Streptomyces sp. NPDC005500 TaxID=3155007 RepID=UPI0033BD96DA